MDKTKNIYFSIYYWDMVGFGVGLHLEDKK